MNSTDNQQLSTSYHCKMLRWTSHSFKHLKHRVSTAWCHAMPLILQTNATVVFAFSFHYPPYTTNFSSCIGNTWLIGPVNLPFLFHNTAYSCFFQIAWSFNSQLSNALHGKHSKMRDGSRMKANKKKQSFPQLNLFPLYNVGSSGKGLCMAVSLLALSI